MKESSLPDDLRACIEGNRKAQFRLYQRYKLFCFGICLRYARHQQEAEDMMQEGFIRVFKDLNQYQFKGSFEGWIRTVMVRTALMHIRKYRKKELEFVDLEASKINQAADPGWGRFQKKGDHIIQLIQQLPALYQTIFNLRAIEEYRFKEIANMLDMNEATIRSYYFRARKALQTTYSELRTEER